MGVLPPTSAGGTAARTRASQGVRLKIVVVPAVTLVLAMIAGAYVIGASRRGDPHPPASVGGGPAPGTIALDRRGQLIFVNAEPGPRGGRLAAVPLADPAGRHPAGRRTVGELSCVRVYAAARTGVCLTVERRAVPKIRAVVLDRNLAAVRRIDLPGAPSRARVSASGRMVSWTVFVAGDSYLSSGFSTRTGFYDTRTGRVIRTIEEFAVDKGGVRYTSADVNYWGVTFAADDNRFYATLRTRRKTYLVVGDLARGEMRTLRENAECPSLSPDGRLLAFKKATGESSRPWRLHVLDLRTMRETPLAERGSVDDQAAWLDDRTVIYGRAGGTTTDVWAVPADGTGAPRLLIKNALSPAVIR